MESSLTDVLGMAAVCGRKENSGSNTARTLPTSSGFKSTSCRRVMRGVGWTQMPRSNGELWWPQSWMDEPRARPLVTM